MTINFANYVDEFDIIMANNQNITSLDGATFPTEEWIQHAYLGDNQITTLTGVTFPNNLKLINLSNNRITSLEGVTFSSKLTDLILSGNLIGSLAGVVFPPMLRELNLSDNLLTTLEGVVFPESLRELNLSGNTMDLTHGNFRHLTTLLLSLNPLTYTIANNKSIHKTYNDLKIYINGKMNTEFTIHHVDFAQQLQQLQQPPSNIVAWDLSSSPGHIGEWRTEVYPDFVDENMDVDKYMSDGSVSDGGKKRKRKSKRKRKRKSKRKSKRNKAKASVK
jgi:hypothetical protein